LGEDNGNGVVMFPTVEQPRNQNQAPHQIKPQKLYSGLSELNWM